MPCKVFLSHAAFDAEIALHLKSELEQRVPGTDVFLSSDPTDLPPGVLWPAEIQRELRESQVLILLATGRSLGRPWVWFEAGAMWFRDVPLIPLCLGSVRKDTLPSPLRERQGIDADEPADLTVLLRYIAGIAEGMADEHDVTAWSVRLSALEQKAAGMASLTLGGWLGVEWQDRFLAYDGPVEGLRLVEDEYFQQAMAAALEAGGYKVRLGRPDKLGRHGEKGYRIVYLTDRRTWRRKITQIDTVLIASPTR